ncbi:MAG: Rid family detoxifying hydrolase [Thermoanaerobaculum sp.]|nr:Rid family detoxifying hydrolase [Thermoanaerobaculum sp.]MDW7966636.1 Rid family detoxifying hydrolase [Thermoanaerobaculum sp.]
MKPDWKIIATNEAPQAIGPYSQAVQVGSLLFVSGQIPLTPDGGSMPADFAAQARQALANLAAVVRAAGGELTAVAKVNVYLVDLGHFQVFNDIYAQFFGDHRPARAVVQVAALPRGAQVEVEAVAVL